MSTKPYYRFSLRDRATGEYYYILDDGTILLSSTAKYIDDPADWAQMELKISRNKKYIGLFREYSSKIQFVKDAAKILRSLYYQYGADAACAFYVESLDYTTKTYSEFYYNDLDFSQATDSRDIFEISALEAGVTAMIKANEDVEYEIPIDSPDALSIKMTPLLVNGQVRFLTMWPLPVQGTNTNAISITPLTYKLYAIYSDKTIVPVSDTPQNEPVSVTDASTNQYIDGERYEESTSSSFNYGANSKYNYLIRANIDIKNVVVKAYLSFYVENNTGADDVYNVWINKQDNTGTFVSTEYTATSPTITNGGNLTFSFDIETTPFDMTAGEQLYIAFGFNNAGLGANDHDVAWEKSQYIKIDFQHYTDTFVAKGLRWYKVAEKLLKAMTNNTATLYSPYLVNSLPNYATNYDNCPYNTILLSGDSVRGVNTSGYSYPVIKTKWTDLFKDGMSNWGLTMSIDGNTVSLLPFKERFNSTTQIYNLGTVADCHVESANDLRYKAINVGGKDFQNFDQLNGRDEFNVPTVFNIPTTTASGVLDLMSPYQSGCYPIFNTWAKYALQDTTNSQSDNEIFVVEVASATVGGYYVPYKPSGTITGVEDPNSMFNFGLSPKRRIKRNGAKISGSLFGRSTDYITFQTSSKNSNLYTDFGNGVFDEDADIIVSSLPDALYYPFYITIDTEVPRNLISLITTTPEGYFTFTWRGNTFKGYPMEITIVPSLPKKQTLQLLATIDNTMTLMNG